MKLPSPPARYDPADQAQLRQAVAAADAQTYKRGRDVELQPGQRLILRAGDGSRWRVVVSAAGVLSAVAADP